MSIPQKIDSITNKCSYSIDIEKVKKELVITDMNEIAPNEFTDNVTVMDFGSNASCCDHMIYHFEYTMIPNVGRAYHVMFEFDSVNKRDYYLSQKMYDLLEKNTLSEWALVHKAQPHLFTQENVHAASALLFQGSGMIVVTMIFTKNNRIHKLFVCHTEQRWDILLKMANVIANFQCEISE
jgi:hypothetical protein